VSRGGESRRRAVMMLTQASYPPSRRKEKCLMSPTSIPPENGGLSYAVVVMITGAVAFSTAVISLFSAWIMNERRLTDLLNKQRRDYEVKAEEMADEMDGKLTASRQEIRELQAEMRTKYITHEQCQDCKSRVAEREHGIGEGIEKLCGQMTTFQEIMEQRFVRYDRILMVLVNRSPDILPAEKEALFP